ncbi:Na+/H+ antiporter NhaA [Gleimia coleocanis DSM 15436]|uniref:Na(+)/H(+) antiporter NhaA n=1 Tax=Gleimia coleocanis DSM 15436 TaxID=525245 RepID=C0VZM4_9ACTO|nr:Na+/H+ antiporter NhaA [Gleimia coleocanis]EEH64143.1 Na+/H+ antiporter NhaA [Gleimia coleocanis DSM 15436]
MRSDESRNLKQNQRRKLRTLKSAVSKRKQRPAFHAEPETLSQKLQRLPIAAKNFVEDETRSGMLLVAAAVIALLWANSPWSAIYEHISHTEIGIESLHLKLSISHWAADGLLTIFFFIVGLELKTEFVTGALRDLKEATLPMIAAAFGMLGPALVYVSVQLLTGSDTLHGWAIPAATDIAFAVALLGLFGKSMPPAARTFLLTLAVVDDLLAIIVIAAFYSNGLNWGALVISLLVIALFGLLVQKRMMKWWILIPLGVIAWGFMHASGVHATIAGVAMGLLVPATRRQHEPQWSSHLAHLIHPYSAGIVVPVFAFFAAGVNISESGGLFETLTDPVSAGVILGLPLGKLLGILGAVAFFTRFTSLRLGKGVDLPDIAAIALLAGIGFTVSLLIAGLAFPADSVHIPHAKLGVMMGTLIAAILGGVAVHLRVKQHKRGTAPNRRK